MESVTGKVREGGEEDEDHKWPRGDCLHTLGAVLSYGVFERLC